MNVCNNFCPEQTPQHLFSNVINRYSARMRSTTVLMRVTNLLAK